MTKHQQPSDQRQQPSGGQPGDGAGRREDPGTRDAGVWPVSGPPDPDPNARPQPMASFGQGARGAAGYAAHGDSEVQTMPPSGTSERGGAADARQRPRAGKVGATGSNFGEVDPGVGGSGDTVGEVPGGAGGGAGLGNAVGGVGRGAGGAPQNPEQGAGEGQTGA